MQNRKWVCFVRYLKIINTFFEKNNNMITLYQFVWETQKLH